MEKSTQNTTLAQFIKDKFGLTEANLDDGYDITVISKDITKITNIRTGDTMKLYANGDIVYLSNRGALYYFRDKLKAYIVRPDNSEVELTVGNT